ncbi:MAG: alpha/beta hydrolase [Acidobacteria bacterium]|nr:alpha/beta hydrolase [Acidobacteriota bacterium]
MRHLKTKHTLWVTTLLLLVTGALCAQDIRGDWQGTLEAREMRMIIRISKQLDGSLEARIIRVGENVPDWGSGNRANSVSLEGSDFRFTVDSMKVVYEGKLSAGGNSMTGTLTQGGSLPLELHRATKDTAWRDPVPHTDQFVTVDQDVRLEVLDWGGSGPPLVLLAGMGNTAHIFDRLAPKLIHQFHVYGITRRGFGASSRPFSGYSADRLADDVLRVIDALKLNRPVLAGHSVAGEEMSSIGSRYPEKVAGLVYLEAAHAYAIDDAALSCSLPPAPPQKASPKTVQAAIQAGTQRYTSIRAPALAIYAAPKEGTPPNGAAPARDGCAKAFAKGAPLSRIVRVPGATHYVFLSNESEVLKEIRSFVGGLKK